MTQSIDQALVIEFAKQVDIRAQQMKSRFRGKVMEIPVTGNQYAIERLDKVEAIEILTRHATTQAQDITHDRREIKMRDFRCTLLLDEPDQLQTLIDPRKEYSAAVARAMVRQYDRLVAEAAFATVNTGRTFNTPLAFGADDGITITSGGVGLTYDKLVTIKENFVNNNVGVDDMEEFHIAVAAQQNSNMLKETELTNHLYTSEYVIEKGEVNKAIGMDVIMFSGTQSPAVLNKTGVTRDCIAFTKSAIKVGICKDITLHINERPDKNNALQIQATFYLGATRSDGRKVQKVQCTEI